MLTYCRKPNLADYHMVIEALYELVAPVTRAELSSYVASKLSLTQLEVEDMVNAALRYGLHFGYVKLFERKYLAHSVLFLVPSKLAMLRLQKQEQNRAPRYNVQRDMRHFGHSALRPSRSA